LYVSGASTDGKGTLRLVVVADGYFVRAAVEPPLSRYVTPIDISYGKQLQEFTDSLGQYIRTALEKS
jgi:hypothetical protein